VLLEALLALSLAREPYPTQEGDARLDEYQFAQVQRVDVSDGKTKVSAETNAPTPGAGTWPIRVFIDNAAGPAGPLELEFRGYSDGSHSVTRTIDLRAGERRLVSLTAPVELRSGTLVARGPGTHGSGGSLYFHTTWAPNKVVLCLGRPDAYERFVGKAPNYSGEASLQVVAVPLNEAPDALAALVGYDAVVLPDSGALEELDETQRRALEAYVAVGGNLIVEGPLRGARALPLLTGTAAGLHPYGFGEVWVHDGAPLELHLSMRSELPVNPQGALPDYELRYGGNRFEALLPQATAPLGRFLFIIGLFTLAIGPGSILVARRRGPAMLLLTIPVTAAITCGLIIGYSLIADGFTVHASSYGVTLLDARAHRAVTVGVNAYYANLSPPKATYSAMTAVVSPWGQERARFAADMAWRDGLTMGSDFIPSRLYREWGFLSVEPTRARLVLKRQGDALLVQNALGHPIDELEVNVDGVAYHVEDVRDGGEAALVRGELPSFDQAHPDRFGAPIMIDVRAPLEPGRFRARLSDSGFVPTGALVVQLHPGEQWVLGELEP
jgi:hypothetical protein